MKRKFQIWIRRRDDNRHNTDDRRSRRRWWSTRVTAVACRVSSSYSPRSVVLGQQVTVRRCAVGCTAREITVRSAHRGHACARRYPVRPVCFPRNCCAVVYVSVVTCLPATVVFPISHSSRLPAVRDRRSPTL